MDETKDMENESSLAIPNNHPAAGVKNCTLCGSSTPAVKCDKCGSQAFCLSCDDMYHRHPKRRYHLRKAVDSIWNTCRSPRLRRRTELPGDPSKIPVAPPRSKKRHSSSGLFDVPAGYKGFLQQKKMLEMQRATVTAAKAVSTPETTDENVTMDQETMNVVAEPATVVTPEAVNVQSSQSECNTINVATPSPIQMFVPGVATPQARNTLEYAQPMSNQVLPHTVSASDLTSAASSHTMPPMYHLPPHMHAFMHPHMNPYSPPAMAHFNCPQCISASWSNLMSPSMAAYHQLHMQQQPDWIPSQSPMSRSQNSPAQETMSRHEQSPLSFHGSLFSSPGFQYPSSDTPNMQVKTEPIASMDVQHEEEKARSPFSPDVSTSGMTSGQQAQLQQILASDEEMEEEEEEVEVEVEVDKTDDFVIPEKPSTPWECAHCTYVNPPGSHICEVCCKTSYQTPKEKKKIVTRRRVPKKTDAASRKVEDTVDASKTFSPINEVDTFSLNRPQKVETTENDASSCISPETLAQWKEIECKDLSTTETQTIVKTTSTDVQTQKVKCTSTSSSTDGLFRLIKHEMSSQTNIEDLAPKRSISTDPMISSQSMESLLSGVSAPPYHNRHAGMTVGSSFSTQSLSTFDRGHSRSPIPRSSSMLGEVRSFGRGLNLFQQDSVTPHWGSPWLASDPMYYKPNILMSNSSKDEYFEGTWGSVDRLNKKISNAEEGKGQKVSTTRHHRSLEDLKTEQLSEAPSIMQCLQTVKNAERCGFSVEDLQVAYFNCGREDPLLWLKENWDQLVQSVITLAAKCAEENEEHDVGPLTITEAKHALQNHGGNIWDAVTECIEVRQRKILELTVRGNFTQKQIVEALKNNGGNVELAYADLIRTTSKLFKHILSPGLSEESEDTNLQVPTLQASAETDNKVTEKTRSKTKEAVPELEEVSAEKKRADFLTKLTAIREAQSERRKAREEKEIGRDVEKVPLEEVFTSEEADVPLLQEKVPLEDVFTSEEIDVHFPQAEDESEIKPTDVLITESVENQPLLEASQFEIISADMDEKLSDEYDMDVEKTKKPPEEGLHEVHDGTWIDSQGEWIEEFSDEQWDEEGEGEGEWVTIRTRYKKMESDLDVEAMEMAALWGKEELADDVFEEEIREGDLRSPKPKTMDESPVDVDKEWSGIDLKASILSQEGDVGPSLMQQDNDYDLDANDNWIVEDTEKLLRSPENEVYVNEEEDEEKEVPLDTLNEDEFIQKLESISQKITDELEEELFRERKMERDSLEGSIEDDWEKLDLQKEKETSKYDEEIEDVRLQPAQEQVEFDNTVEQEMAKQLFEESPLDVISQSLVEDHFQHIEDKVVEAIESTVDDSQDFPKPEIVDYPPKPEIVDHPPKPEIVDHPPKPEIVDSPPKLPARRKSKLSDNDVKQILDVDIPPALPLKAKDRLNSEKVTEISIVEKPLPLPTEAVENVVVETVAEEEVLPMDDFEKDERIELEGSPLTSFSCESDSNFFADSESELEVNKMRQKKYHRNELKDAAETEGVESQDEVLSDDLKDFEDEVPIVEDINISKEKYTYEEPCEEDIISHRPMIEESINPKAFRESAGRPLQLFRTTPSFEEKQPVEDTSRDDNTTSLHQDIRDILPEKPLAFEPEEQYLEPADEVTCDQPQQADLIQELSTPVSQEMIQIMSFDHPEENTESIPMEEPEVPALAEMEATSSVADYFFGRYNEIVVVKKEKKKPGQIRSQKISNVPPTAKVIATPMMSHSAITISKSKANESIPSQLTTSEIIAETPKSDQLSNSQIHETPTTIDEPISSSSTAAIKPSEPAKSIPISIPAQAKSPEPAEVLSFAEDYFFGSYNEVVIPKKSKKKGQQQQQPVITTTDKAKQYLARSYSSEVLSPTESNEDSVDATATESSKLVEDVVQKEDTSCEMKEMDTSAILLTEKGSVIPLENDNIAPPRTEILPLTPVSVNQTFSPNETTAKLELLPPAKAEKILPVVQGSLDKENISRGKSVRFEETQDTIVAPPRVKKTKKEESKVATESFSHVGDEYLFGRYDEIVPTTKFTSLSKKKLPPYIKDLGRLPSAVPRDTPLQINVFPYPSDEADSLLPSDSNIVTELESGDEIEQNLQIDISSENDQLKDSLLESFSENNIDLEGIQDNGHEEISLQTKIVSESTSITYLSSGSIVSTSQTEGDEIPFDDDPQSSNSQACKMLIYDLAVKLVDLAFKSVIPMHIQSDERIPNVESSDADVKAYPEHIESMSQFQDQPAPYEEQYLTELDNFLSDDYYDLHEEAIKFDYDTLIEDDGNFTKSTKNTSYDEEFEEDGMVEQINASFDSSAESSVDTAIELVRGCKRSSSSSGADVINESFSHDSVEYDTGSYFFGGDDDNLEKTVCQDLDLSTPVVEEFLSETPDYDVVFSEHVSSSSLEGDIYYKKYNKGLDGVELGEVPYSDVVTEPTEALLNELIHDNVTDAEHEGKSENIAENVLPSDSKINVRKDTSKFTDSFMDETSEQEVFDDSYMSAVSRYYEEFIESAHSVTVQYITPIEHKYVCKHSGGSLPSSECSSSDSFESVEESDIETIISAPASLFHLSSVAVGVKMDRTLPQEKVDVLNVKSLASAPAMHQAQVVMQHSESILNVQKGKIPFYSKIITYDQGTSTDDEEDAVETKKSPVNSVDQSCQTDDIFEEDDFFDSLDDNLPSIPSSVAADTGLLRSEIGIQCQMIQALPQYKITSDEIKTSIDFTHLSFDKPVSEQDSDSFESQTESDSDLYLDLKSSDSSHVRTSVKKHSGTLTARFIDIDSGTGSISGSDVDNIEQFVEVESSDGYRSDSSVEQIHKTITERKVGVSSVNINVDNIEQFVEVESSDGYRSDSSVEQIHKTITERKVGVSSANINVDEVTVVPSISEQSFKTRQSDDQESLMKVESSTEIKQIIISKSESLANQTVSPVVKTTKSRSIECPSPVPIPVIPSVTDLQFVQTTEQIQDIEPAKIEIIKQEKSSTVEFFDGPLPQSVLCGKEAKSGKKGDVSAESDPILRSTMQTNVAMRDSPVISESSEIEDMWDDVLSQTESSLGHYEEAQSTLRESTISSSEYYEVDDKQTQNDYFTDATTISECEMYTDDSHVSSLMIDSEECSTASAGDFDIACLESLEDSIIVADQVEDTKYTSTLESPSEQEVVLLAVSAQNIDSMSSVKTERQSKTTPTSKTHIERTETTNLSDTQQAIVHQDTEQTIDEPVSELADISFHSTSDRRSSHSSDEFLEEFSHVDQNVIEHSSYADAVIQDETKGILSISSEKTIEKPSTSYIRLPSTPSQIVSLKSLCESHLTADPAIGAERELRENVRSDELRTTEVQSSKSDVTKHEKTLIKTTTVVELDRSEKDGSIKDFISEKDLNSNEITHTALQEPFEFKDSTKADNLIYTITSEKDSSLATHSYSTTEGSDVWKDSDSDHSLEDIEDNFTSVFEDLSMDNENGNTSNVSPKSYEISQDHDIPPTKLKIIPERKSSITPEIISESVKSSLVEEIETCHESTELDEKCASNIMRITHKLPIQSEQVSSSLVLTVTETDNGNDKGDTSFHSLSEDADKLAEDTSSLYVEDNDDSILDYSLSTEDKPSSDEIPDICPKVDNRTTILRDFVEKKDVDLSVQSYDQESARYPVETVDEDEFSDVPSSPVNDDVDEWADVDNYFQGPSTGHKVVKLANEAALFAEECEIFAVKEEVVTLNVKDTTCEASCATIASISYIQDSDLKDQESSGKATPEELTKSSADKADTVADFSELSEISDFPTDTNGTEAAVATASQPSPLDEVGLNVDSLSIDENFIDVLSHTPPLLEEDESTDMDSDELGEGVCKSKNTHHPDIFPYSNLSGSARIHKDMSKGYNSDHPVGSETLETSEIESLMTASDLSVSEIDVSEDLGMENKKIEFPAVRCGEVRVATEKTIELDESLQLGRLSHSLEVETQEIVTLPLTEHKESITQVESTLVPYLVHVPETSKPEADIDETVSVNDTSISEIQSLMTASDLSVSEISTSESLLVKHEKMEMLTARSVDVKVATEKGVERDESPQLLNLAHSLQVETQEIVTLSITEHKEDANVAFTEVEFTFEPYLVHVPETSEPDIDETVSANDTSISEIQSLMTASDLSVSEISTSESLLANHEQMESLTVRSIDVKVATERGVELDESPQLLNLSHSLEVETQEIVTLPLTEHKDYANASFTEVESKFVPSFIHVPETLPPPATLKNGREQIVMFPSKSTDVEADINQTVSVSESNISEIHSFVTASDFKISESLPMENEKIEIATSKDADIKVATEKVIERDESPQLGRLSHSSFQVETQEIVTLPLTEHKNGIIDTFTEVQSKLVPCLVHVPETSKPLGILTSGTDVGNGIIDLAASVAETSKVDQEYPAADGNALARESQSTADYFSVSSANDSLDMFTLPTSEKLKTESGRVHEKVPSVEEKCDTPKDVDMFEADTSADFSEIEEVSDLLFESKPSLEIESLPLEYTISEQPKKLQTTCLMSTNEVISSESDKVNKEPCVLGKTMNTHTKLQCLHDDEDTSEKSISFVSIDESISRIQESFESLPETGNKKGKIQFLQTEKASVDQIPGLSKIEDDDRDRLVSTSKLKPRLPHEAKAKEDIVKSIEEIVDFSMQLKIEEKTSDILPKEQHPVSIASPSETSFTNVQSKQIHKIDSKSDEYKPSIEHDISMVAATGESGTLRDVENVLEVSLSNAETSKPVIEKKPLTERTTKNSSLESARSSDEKFSKLTDKTTAQLTDGKSSESTSKMLAMSTAEETAKLTDQKSSKSTSKMFVTSTAEETVKLTDGKSSKLTSERLVTSTAEETAKLSDGKGSKSTSEMLVTSTAEETAKLTDDRNVKSAPFATEIPGVTGNIVDEEQTQNFFHKNYEDTSSTDTEMTFVSASSAASKSDAYSDVSSDIVSDRFTESLDDKKMLKSKNEFRSNGNADVVDFRLRESDTSPVCTASESEINVPAQFTRTLDEEPEAFSIVLTPTPIEAFNDYVRQQEKEFIMTSIESDYHLEEYHLLLHHIEEEKAVEPLLSQFSYMSRQATLKGFPTETSLIDERLYQDDDDDVQPSTEEYFNTEDRHGSDNEMGSSLYESWSERSFEIDENLIQYEDEAYTEEHLLYGEAYIEDEEAILREIDLNLQNFDENHLEIEHDEIYEPSPDLAEEYDIEFEQIIPSLPPIEEEELPGVQFGEDSITDQSYNLCTEKSEKTSSNIASFVSVSNEEGVDEEVEEEAIDEMDFSFEEEVSPILEKEAFGILDAVVPESSIKVSVREEEGLIGKVYIKEVTDSVPEMKDSGQDVKYSIEKVEDANGEVKSSTQVVKDSKNENKVPKNVEDVGKDFAREVEHSVSELEGSVKDSMQKEKHSVSEVEGSVKDSMQKEKHSVSEVKGSVKDSMQKEKHSVSEVKGSMKDSMQKEEHSVSEVKGSMKDSMQKEKHSVSEVEGSVKGMKDFAKEVKDSVQEVKDFKKEEKKDSLKVEASKKEENKDSLKVEEKKDSFKVEASKQEKKKDSLKVEASKKEEKKHSSKVEEKKDSLKVDVAKEVHDFSREDSAKESIMMRVSAKEVDIVTKVQSSLEKGEVSGQEIRTFRSEESSTTDSKSCSQIDGASSQFEKSFDLKLRKESSEVKSETLLESKQIEKPIDQTESQRKEKISIASRVDTADVSCNIRDSKLSQKSISSADVENTLATKVTTVITDQEKLSYNSLVEVGVALNMEAKTLVPTIASEGSESTVSVPLAPVIVPIKEPKLSADLGSLTMSKPDTEDISKHSITDHSTLRTDQSPSMEEEPKSPDIPPKKPNILKSFRETSQDEVKPALPQKLSRSRLSSTEDIHSTETGVIRKHESVTSRSSRSRSSSLETEISSDDSDLSKRRRERKCSIPQDKESMPPELPRRRSKDHDEPASTSQHSDSESAVGKVVIRRRSSAFFEPPALPQKRLSIEDRMAKLQSEGKCSNKDRAFIAAKLIEMQFEEEDALLASKQCNNVYHAVKFLTQLCEMCNGHYPIHQISSMVYCSHRACRDCLKAHFTNLIYDRSIFALLCPICQKPDISDHNIQDYFNHLDMMLRRILKDDVYDLFQRKLRDEVLTKDPNFHWCSQCSSGFIASPRLKKLYCPDCLAITCASCHQTWELEHEGVHCERFQQWKDMHTPEPPPAGLVKALAERGITCPSCELQYAHASAGCMIYKCSHCSFEFCAFCLSPFIKIKECTKTEVCKHAGVHAHHPYNCLFYLRDKDPSEIQEILVLSNVPYMTIPPPDQIVKSRCQVREQKHIHGTLSEDRCSRDIEPYFAGLCRIHYKEYLAELIRKHKIDPTQSMTTMELEFVLRKARIFIPERVKGETTQDFKAKILKIIKTQLT